MKRERKRDFTAIAFGFDCCVELIEKADPAFAAETNDIARLEAARRLGEGAPARAVEPFDQVCGYARLVFAAADTAATQERRNDFGVVDHYRIAGAQQFRQIADQAVLKLRRRAGCGRPGAARRHAATRAATQCDPPAGRNQTDPCACFGKAISVSLSPPLSHHR